MSFLSAAATLLVATDVARAQNVAIFPDEYAAVPEGPLNSPNIPLAGGTSRVQCLYDLVDLAIPIGDQITKVGFRQDGATGTPDAGVAMQLEIRMGWSTADHQSMGNNFDNNYDGAPVTVFGPALYTPPTLRDPANPLPNGQFFIDLTTPFAFQPNGRNLLVEYRIYGTANGGAQFVYRLDRADFYSPVTYGPAGCQHSGGNTPNHTVQPTRPGLAWSGQVASGPANAPAFVAIAVDASLAQPYPIGPVFPGISPTCTGQMPVGALALLSGTTSGSGGKFWSFQIPNDNTFADMPITSQVLMLDFFSPGQVVVSNGAEVVTGVRTRSTVLSAAGAPTQLTTGSKLQHYCPVALFVHQ
ncbi:MAG: hypothetical protein KAI24_07510 [Planctomycetes bacterium]|nr:hypothetical protein [Planctomycetota bacterium]